MADNNTTIKPYVITVGRQFGSGGRELGKALASRLGIDYFDKELLMEAARESGLSPEFFEKADERFPSFLNGLFSFSMGVTPMCYYTGAGTITDDGLYRALSDFILKRAEEKPFVVVGRSADYILRNHPRVANLFVHAPMEECVRRIVSRNDAVTPQQAEAMARKTNKWRADYYNFFTDKEWGRADSYHLTLDSATLPIDKCVDMVVEYIRACGFIG